MPVDELERGRALCAEGAWLAAYDALAGADRADPLQVDDLQLLAMAGYMLGRDEEYLSALERAHQLHLDAGATLPAARVAFWAGMHLMVEGEVGRGTGWLGRAQRLVEQTPGECVERGYLMIPAARRHERAGDLEAALATAADAAAIAQRFGDRDLFGMSVHMQGRLLVDAGRIVEGLALFDEAMVAVTAGELSPMATGIVYCGVIIGCRAAQEPRRAQEWTAALTRWCERQPDMVAFSGRCHVHRAEIMQLTGAWSEALDEARSAADRAALGNHRSALGEAAYVQGDVHRLRGEFAEAEAAYRQASLHGREPQPGLALLRLAQGNVDAALATIRRVLGGTTRTAERVGLLPAAAEVMLAAGDLEAARSACDELADAAAGNDVGVLEAIAAQTRGAVELAAGEASAALIALRQAWRVWEDIEAPYDAARVRALIGEACAALDDHDAAALEFEAAAHVFAELGAAPDLARLDASTGAADAHGLTARELQVLRLVAAGRTNKAIADELVLSDRTVDRHVSNIFTKLSVSSRSAATAYAYEHHLV